jgi:magnesium-transporting ATPase (P-type)
MNKNKKLKYMYMRKFYIELNGDTIEVSKQTKNRINVLRSISNLLFFVIIIFALFFYAGWYEANVFAFISLSTIAFAILLKIYVNKLKQRIFNNPSSFES